MDPWVRLGFDSERLLSVMTSSANSTTGFCICIDGEPAGAMVTRDGWLLGPYLAILAVSPRYQGLGAGYAALRWFERDAIGKGARNLWLTAASFNLRALAAYERCGFVRVGHLQGLLAEGLDEVLMRKQLAPSPKPPAV